MFKEIERLNDEIVRRKRSLEDLSTTLDRYETALAFEFRSILDTRNQELVDKIIALPKARKLRFVQCDGVSNYLYIIQHNLGPELFNYIKTVFEHPIDDDVCEAALKSQNPAYAEVIFQKSRSATAPQYSPSIGLVKSLIRQNGAAEIARLRGLVGNDIFSMIERNSGVNYTQRLFYGVYDNIVAPVVRIFTKKPKENVGLTFLHYAKAVGANGDTIAALKAAGVAEIRDRNGRGYEAYEGSGAKNIFERPSWIRLIKKSFGLLGSVISKLYSYCTVAGRQRCLNDINDSLRSAEKSESPMKRLIKERFEANVKEGKVENLRYMLRHVEVLKEARVDFDSAITEAIKANNVDIVRVMVEKLRTTSEHLTLALNESNIDLVKAVLPNVGLRSEDIDKNLDIAFSKGLEYARAILGYRLLPSRNFVIHQLQSENLEQLQVLKEARYDFKALQKMEGEGVNAVGNVFKNAWNGGGESFLHIAMSQEEPSMAVVKFLLDCGVDPNIRNAKGRLAHQLHEGGDSFIANARVLSAGEGRRREGAEYMAMSSAVQSTAMARPNQRGASKCVVQR